MSRTLGTVVRGVRAPIFREGDSVVDITVSTVLNALAENNITARDGDVVAVTESVVARCQGNYATCEQIAADVKAKTGGKTVGVAFPILSRNRFSLLLRGIAMGAEKVVLLLSYPSDEVGNHLVSLDQLDEAGIDPWHDVLSLAQFRAAFGEVVHPFTGVDYVAYYGDLIREAGVLGHGDVADHDLGLVLAHGLLHVLGLGFGLLAEGTKGELVALALGGALILGFTLWNELPEKK